MEAVQRFKRKIIQRSVLLIVLWVIAALIINKRSWIPGGLFGSAISVLNFHLLSMDVSKLSVLSMLKMRSLLIMRFYVRYIIIGLGIIIAVKYEIALMPFTAGLFLVPITIFCGNFLGVRHAV